MFELVRQYKQEITIAAAVLVTLAFGITGVVIQVLSPGRNSDQQKAGSFSLKAVSSDRKRVEVSSKRFRPFRQRWDNLLLRQLDLPRFLFSSRLMNRKRMYERMIRQALMQSARQNPFLQFILHVQRRMQVDLIRNLIFLRSGEGAFGSETVSIFPETGEAFSNLDRQEQMRIRQKRWQQEAHWRLLYMYELAKASGFSATKAEIQQLVTGYLQQRNRRGGSNMTYDGFVGRFTDMSMRRFEQTMKEMLTVLKYLGSVSLATTPEPDSLLSGFNEDEGAGKLVVSTLNHRAFRSRVLSDRDRTLRNRFLTLHPGKKIIDELSDFVSEQDGGSSTPQGGNQSDAPSFSDRLQKRQFAYLYLPVDAFRDQVESPSDEEIRAYYNEKKDEKFKKPGSSSEDDNRDGAGGESTSTGDQDDNEQGGGESSDAHVPLRTVRDQIRETLVRKRALRKADRAFSEFMDSVIRPKEIRGKPIDFRELADEDHVGGRLEYRVSPLLDREDMTYWLTERKKMRESHREPLMKTVFDGALQEGDAGPYPDHPIWFENGVVLPRLVRVERGVLVPSVRNRPPADGAGTVSALSMDEYETNYPVWSLQLKDTLRWRLLDRDVKQRTSDLASRFLQAYRTDRSARERDIEFMGPPVPSSYWALDATDSTTPESDAAAQKGDGVDPSSPMETAGPPAFLRETTFEDQISVRKRFRDAAREAFRNTAETLGLEVHESELFNLQNPPETVDMVDSLRRKLLGGGRRGPRGRSQEGASLYEPKKASGTDRTQVAMLTVKLPRGPEQLDQFLKENRRNSIISSRSSFLQKNVGVFLSQADLSLVTPPPGSEATERKETSSSERTPGDRPDE